MLPGTILRDGRLLVLVGVLLSTGLRVRKDITEATIRRAWQEERTFSS